MPEHDDTRRERARELDVEQRSYSDELLGSPRGAPREQASPCDPVIIPGEGPVPRTPADEAACEEEREREQTRRKTKI